MLAPHPDLELSVFHVWVPGLGEVGPDGATAMAAELDDPRVRHYWDPGMDVGRTVSQRLDLVSPSTWDVYLFFGDTARWGALAPVPERWIHTMEGIVSENRVFLRDFPGVLSDMLSRGWGAEDATPRDATPGREAP